MTVDEANRALREADLLVTGQEVTAAMERLAEEIATHLAQDNPITLCVMNGGLIFAGQLLTRLAFPLEVDYCHASRYGNNTTGRALEWLVRPQLELRDRTVLILDDILDEGVTLAAIADYCRTAGAARVLIAVLVNKQHDRKASPGFRADFTAIEVEDRFLFGYGLDYQGYWRNAAGIYAVKGL